jgi:S-adenosyl-L-methionine hydrolase (adenosine-forming)
MDRPVISFLTDFGADAAAAICRGVMLDIARDAQIVDISHSVRKYAVRDGAFLLWCALPWLPVGVHVAVVDPGVGTSRLPIGIRTGRGDVLIGPDNGLLVPGAGRLGGIVEVRALENRAFMLAATAATFHGRDIFAPMAAHLAAGRPFAEVGPAIDPGSIVSLHFPDPTIAPGVLDTSVVYVDSFGNLRLAGDSADLAAAIGPLAPGRELAVTFAAAPGSPAIREVVPWAATFGQVPAGRPLLYEDSFGRLAYADNQGDVAGRLGLGVDRPARIEPA